MHATFRRLSRSAGRLHSAIKWLFPDWERTEWEVSSSSGCRTSPEQKSLQKLADPDGSRRAKTRCAHPGPVEHDVTADPARNSSRGFSIAAAPSSLPAGWFLFFFFPSSPPQCESRQGWSSQLPRRVRSGKRFQCVSIFTPRTEKPGMSGMFTPRDIKLADGRRRGEWTREAVGKSVSAQILIVWTPRFEIRIGWRLFSSS